MSLSNFYYKYTNIFRSDYFYRQFNVSIWSYYVVCTAPEMTKRNKASQTQQGWISQTVKQCYMYDDTVGAWLTVTRAFQLLYVYCQLLGYHRNERKSPECKVVWSRHSFPSNFKCARLNVGWWVNSFHVFYIMFLLVNNKKKTFFV